LKTNQNFVFVTRMNYEPRRVQHHSFRVLSRITVLFYCASSSDIIVMLLIDANIVCWTKLTNCFICIFSWIHDEREGAAHLMTARSATSWNSRRCLMQHFIGNSHYLLYINISHRIAEKGVNGTSFFGSMHARAQLKIEIISRITFASHFM